MDAASATVTKCELDRDDGRQIYEIEFWAGRVEYDYEVDAASGNVLKQEQETHALGLNEAITPDAARDAALAAAGCALNDVWDLDVSEELDERVPCYEVEFKHGGIEYEYRISAADGSVLDVKQERD